MATYVFWGVVATTLVSGLICSAMAVIAWRNHDRPAAAAFGWLMVAAAAWAFMATARLLTDQAAGAYLFDRIARAASSSTAPLVLVFVFSYIGREDVLTPRFVGSLWLVPAGYTVLSATAPFHDLVAGPGSVWAGAWENAAVLTVTEGIPSQIDLLYTYLLLAVAFLLLARFLVRSRAIYRLQTATVVTAILVPVILNAATQFHRFSHPGVDLTPAALGLTGLVLGWGLFRYDLLDVRPLASDILVDELPDPVFVLAEDGRILDHNRAAETMFDADPLCGRRLSDVAPRLAERLDGSSVYSRSDPASEEVTYFDPQVTSIDDQHGIERGRLIVLRDVTGQQRRQDRLEALQAATQQFITANSVERIAELTVTFADRVLDQDAAAVYIHEDDRLRPVAASDALERECTLTELTVEDADHPVYTAYESETIDRADVRDSGTTMPFRYLLLVPIDDHGVLAIGSREPGAFVTEDEQFATILARTTQVAFTQVDREHELRQSRQAIERRNEQVAFFNGVLRHTLRNALLVIEGRANHLRDHVDDARKRHLDRIVQWCEDLSELSEEIEAINDTVTASEAQRLDWVDLGRVLSDRVDVLSEEFTDVTIDVTVDDGLTVLANDLVEKVVDSVISNAITHNDAPAPRVEITASEIADRVQLRVADNGPGMTDEMKETVFERNVGASQTSHGFGLYFVSVMMNLYGGTVWIEDNDIQDDGTRRGAVAVLEFQQAETQHTSRSPENERT
ncbi:histidine kinase N-terminal 7TM domain-containing protein [Halomicrobium sp. LC1Hm]|uniref:sensor histidine kinase n=1 Tax=Halomicrobium sp. LC1Hm TaxID=2610902 RepID=UPI0012984712|nr:histidine kinase N-terminal 7TM domain-containing protein [Halomicrobium sp. LC1Hm]QGA81749.1 Signal transduction histidine kinase, contains PAS domain [Halomicrobium sp. LC1Hm]